MRRLRDSVLEKSWAEFQVHFILKGASVYQTTHTDDEGRGALVNSTTASDGVADILSPKMNSQPHLTLPFQRFGDTAASINATSSFLSAATIFAAASFALPVVLNAIDVICPMVATSTKMLSRTSITSNAL